ncbi:Hypothetical predicted protein [Cloeon dipterum]|uniref:Endocuticle structural glycoprotein SgAbd-2 n=1 Tax=Cloeon dipterum TaxID=197152 RepID=A0A8S1DES9_9INSE|nr:Hypothetical predicted protein [Cloeon dipterum]
MQKLVLFLALFAVAYVHAQEDKDAVILNSEQDGPHFDGQYKYGFDTSNNIKVSETVSYRTNPQRSNDEDALIKDVGGRYSYTDPKSGQTFTVTYTANENGYQAVGDHLPTSPPVPAIILRALEFTRSQQAKNVKVL